MSILSLLGSLLFMLSAPAGSKSTELRPPVPLLVDGKPLDVGRDGHSAPFVGDFDGDGRSDLLVGQYHEGRLGIYRDRADNGPPRFQHYTWFEADGKPGRVPEGCCIGFTPQLVDLDGDGRTDILSGSWPGEIYWFRRKVDGTFAAAEKLKDRRGQFLDVGSASSTFAADWNGDGRLDLIVGTVLGEVHFIPREGRVSELAFGSPGELQADGRPIKVANDAAPVAADWDGDGRLDLIVGAEDGSVGWYRNSGTPRTPKLEAVQPLIGPSPLGWGDDEKRRPGDWGLRAKPCVLDWDGDGRLDILLGDRCGRYRGKPVQTDQEQREERQANDTLPDLRRKWATAFRTYRQVDEVSAQESSDDRQQRQRRGDELRREMIRYKEEITAVQSIQQRYQPGDQSHGFVWIFLRQPAAGTKGR